MDSKLLLVDDDPGMIQVMARILSGVGQLRFATSGAAALQQAREICPDLILLDAEMPDMSGYEVCEALKADAALADIPVIFVTAHGEQAFELKGLAVGAVDFLAKPISEPLLLARVRTQLRVKRLTDELKRIGTVDALTETMNRRAFDTALALEWKRGIREGQPISLLLVDVDHFKLFNDTYGHPAGDVCLRSIAQALRHAVARPADVVARYGGEEFALLLPRTSRRGAEHLADRVLAAVEAIRIPHAESPTAAMVTVSIGLGCRDEGSRSWMSSAMECNPPSDLSVDAARLLQCADQALYAAKRGGRAQAWRLDIDDAGAPALALEITRAHVPRPSAPARQTGRLDPVAVTRP